MPTNHLLVFKDRPGCYFLKNATDNATDDHWLTDGCRYLASESDRGLTVCECTHLTNFAAIEDISLREENTGPKHVLTVVLSSLSILSILAALTLSFVFNKEHTYNLMNDQMR